MRGGNPTSGRGFGALFDRHPLRCPMNPFKNGVVRRGQRPLQRRIQQTRWSPGAVFLQQRTTMAAVSASGPPDQSRWPEMHLKRPECELGPRIDSPVASRRSRKPLPSLKAHQGRRLDSKLAVSSTARRVPGPCRFVKPAPGKISAGNPVCDRARCRNGRRCRPMRYGDGVEGCEHELDE